MGVPAVTIETRATAGIGASIVIINGVNAEERSKEDIENAFITRTGFRRGAS